LASIRPATKDRIVRPLIEIGRAEVEQYLRSRNIAWREDSTNASPQFARNRIRHALLPQLEREWNPAIRETLAQTADWAGAEEAYWEAEMDRLAAGFLSARFGAIAKPLANRTASGPGSGPGHHLQAAVAGGGTASRVPAPAGRGFVFINARDLAGLPLAVARRLARRAIEQVKGDLRGIDFGHVEAILSLATSCEGHGRVQAPGLDVLRSFEWLRFGILGSYGLVERAYSVEASVPGIVRVEAVPVEISLELVENSETCGPPPYVYNGGVGCLDWGSLSGRLVLRNWRPGDQYQLIGRTREEKIKTLFQEFRIPIWERRHWPVLTDDGAIVWARRFGPAANRAATADSGTILQIRESETSRLASI
jgi:tRNA(Ile)-lysidine synthase